MADLSMNKYDKPRNWIKDTRLNEGREWDEIRKGCRKDEKDLQKFLSQQIDINFWPELTCEEWVELVNSQEKSEIETNRIMESKDHAMIVETGEENDARVSNDLNSSWQLYRKRLFENGFKEETVDEIQSASFKILKKLSNDTTNIKPIRGLVVGNVQSGKTANMAALMAMAADNGYNMFIILSGTIENLRDQTQERLWKDLHHKGNLSWQGLTHLSKNSPMNQRAEDLDFSPSSKERYFTVCLKHSKRLKDLIQWLQADSNKQAQMKIIVIDDEADQAGINTADVNSNERKAINKCITNLVNGKDIKSKQISSKYKAMNYIGYTATPYANILNESGEDSLYPFNFITTLAVSKEYFGPQQIFGIDGVEEKYEGLDIVNVIDDNELELIKEIHDSEISIMPDSLRNALCWFMCGVACMRFTGYRKPISMLIHTSQKTEHHENIANIVVNWIKKTPKEKLLDLCREVWKTETERFSLEKFKSQYSDYGNKADLKDYPKFEEILPELEGLVDREITNILLDEDEKLTYHQGLQLCVDNCKNNGVNDEGMYVRLAYPTKETMPDFAPAFIVIGGATLSRGLTIEGLISTYFLRSVGQADTLMQMGRWFGYRKGYELMPRIWITHKTNEQFKFLSELDYDLRKEISEMSKIGKTPAEYGARIKNTPKLSFIRITAKNKMQKAITAEIDYSGMYYQTYKFINDKEILKNNIDVVNSFVKQLGQCDVKKDINEHSNNSVVWTNVEFSSIKKMLLNYKFDPRLTVLNNIEVLVKWVEKMTKEHNIDNWNVILAGKANKKNGEWKVPDTDISVYKVNRTKKIKGNDMENEINIGVLRDPKDIIADVDLTGANDELKNMVKNFKSSMAKEIRNKAGLQFTPQIIIYMIDHDSKITNHSNDNNRKDLRAAEDIVGLCIDIPGVKRSKDGVARLSIQLDKVISSKGDLEEIDED